MRLVATLPGSTMLHVTPSRPTSRASVFDQPSRLRRSALEMARFGIGATTPEDVLVMMRPHRRARIPGSTRSATAITDSTIELKCLDQTSTDWPVAGVGGGPPVLLISTSTGPILCSSAVTLWSMRPISLRSQTRGIPCEPASSMSCSVGSSAAASTSAAPTAHLRAPALRRSRGQPAAAPSTKAVFPRRPTP